MDYPVGQSAFAAANMIPWTSFSHAGCTVGATKITCNGQVGLVIDSVDFTASNGASLDIQNCQNITITNCKWGGTNLALVGVGIINLDNQCNGLNFSHNTLDASVTPISTTSQAYVMGSYGDMRVEYNYFKNYTEILNVNTSNLIYRFNLIDEHLVTNPTGGIGTDTHMNCLQWGSGSSTADVSFNTVKQTVFAGSEVFQFYFNFGGTMTNPACNNNVIIGHAADRAQIIAATARLNNHAYNKGDYFTVADANPGIYCHCYTAGITAGSEPGTYATSGDGALITDGTAQIQLIGDGNTVLSYPIHASGFAGTTLVGTGIANNNYFDITDAFGAFYNSSFTGWTRTGNINMVTGGALNS